MSNPSTWLVHADETRFLVRFLCFTVFESPKYHMGKGNDEKAVEIVHEVARRNVEDLKACEGSEGGIQHTDASAAIKRKLQKLNLTHVRALFATKKLALSTTMIMWVWALIGLAFPLYNAFIP